MSWGNEIEPTPLHHERLCCFGQSEIKLPITLPRITSRQEPDERTRADSSAH